MIYNKDTFSIDDIELENKSNTKDSELPNKSQILNFISKAIDIKNGPYLKNNLDINIKSNLITKEDYPITTICYVTNKEMMEINKKFRDKNNPTNILSFPPTPPPGINYESYIGDLVLAPDVIKQEAINQNKKLLNHYAHLFIHGVLHLKGYDHIKDNDAKTMEDLEIELLGYLNIDNPYR